MNVPEIILQQLGGNRFVAMTGVHTLIGHENALSMSLPRNKSKANRLCIEYTFMDDYIMRFYYHRPFRIDHKTGRVTLEENVEIVRYEGVYCDQLCELFTDVTGLRTSL